MAGICAGPGLTTTEDGLLALSGARTQAWPGLCDIETANGVRVDPVTGHVWTHPGLQILSAQDTNPDRAITPVGTGNIALDSLAVQLTVPACSNATLFGMSTGGYAGFRMASGNFWTISRSVVTEVNGSPVATTGNQLVAASENNSGGVDSGGGPVDGEAVILPAVPGDVVRIESTFTLTVSTFTANAANGLNWRAPRLFLMLWSRP